MKKPKFSVIIPVRIETDYLRETLKQLSVQTFKSFEVIIITDKISGPVSPAIKRNLGVKLAKGKYLAFLDDDSYPSPNWLKNAENLFTLNIAAVCGPCLTPPQDNLFQQASGLIWSSYLGSGGAGTYRNHISSARFVDDFPSVNLIVKKTSFDAVSGFDTHHWPGEDTILCLNLVHRLKQKIYYHPSIRVYHHRRNVIVPHLQQITRYALHRGNFARIYPQTSFKIGYFAPSFLTLYLLSLIFFHPFFWLYPLYLYLSLLVYTFIGFLFAKNFILTSFLATITIPITHIYYGVLFIKGFLTPNLGFSAHKVDKMNTHYVGG